MLTLLLKAWRCDDILEALLPGICVPVCSALLSTVLWLGPGEPWLAAAPVVGIIPRWEGQQASACDITWELPLPFWKTSGPSCTLQTCVQPD